MDYLFFSTIKDSGVRYLVVSYDIACQWHKNLWRRMHEVFPTEYRIHRGQMYVIFLVPKFHLPAHIEACNLAFSFNLTKGVARTDGEAPERVWSETNALAYSTREMTPGHRRDTIDDHFNDYNHRKIIRLGKVASSFWMQC